MKTTPSHDGDAVLIHSEQILARLLDDIWTAMLGITVLAGLASLLRIWLSGPSPVVFLHLGVMTIFSICHILRRHLSFNQRMGIVLGLLYLVGSAHLYLFGMVAAGAWWLLLCSLIAAVFNPLRIALLHGGVVVALLLGAGYGYMSGQLTLPFDADVYVRQPSTWFLLLVGCLLLSLLIFSAVAGYQRAVLSLLREVTESRRKLAESEREISTLRSFLPICAQCRQVRDDQGYWANVEDYLHRNALVNFSHGICPDCARALYGTDLSAPSDRQPPLPTDNPAT